MCRGLRDLIWSLAPLEERERGRDEKYAEHGWDKGICKTPLYPPSITCTNSQCGHANKGVEMRDYDKMGRAIILTLNGGVKFTKVVNLTCAGCRRSYRHNYYVHSDSKTRTYYPGPNLPQYIQLDEHHYAETELYLCDKLCHGF
ncbi:hypothetical protein CONPUDRAFT_151576 [Coniophora puteana RWD-64-598 SS2]|uniref:CxC5 like cysteine cluster associated with KDZ domain-containing protein n=1 Tax=Coniophora puteana (strain RWD-64-598) TaxID=741705 RepID=A0A5M3MZK1_CONPW|nr:uncharacterized protein CONPUDRAFT_151576 [Coniophora puteana RWD-64-598 SS2]EIW84559.1 hypothetical protein CONPUDRAFT_151576 [Coniophora puteana RWD-64-598 SS2]